MDGGDAAAVRRWAATGCMALTGAPEGPGLGPPRPLIGALDRVAQAVGVAEPLELLAMRAACAGLTRGGRVSCGGATRLLRAGDGWVAISLPREDDLASVPALVERDDVTDPWSAVAAWCATHARPEIEERATLLGLAVGALADRPMAGGERGVTAHPVDGAPPGGRAMSGLVVIDLSALWAGPLCASLLGRAGCTVIKVESTSRPDGARRGPRAFFDQVNSGKLSVAVDFGTRDGVDVLHRLLARADVVIEASRPRALRQLGIDARGCLASGPRVWVSITAHGSIGPGADRIGFGDDIAVSGGLVAHADGPWFCADAVADPVTGMTAAAAAMEAVSRGGRWHLDVAMDRVCAALAGETVPIPDGVVATPPTAPSPVPPAAVLGAHNSFVTERICTGSS